MNVPWQKSFYTKLSAALLCLLALLGGLQVLLFSELWDELASETSQLLNWSLANQLALELRPLTNDAIDDSALEEKLYRFSELFPQADIYLLDEAGEVRAFFGEQADLLQSVVDLEPLQRFLDKQGQPPLPILGTDPRNPGGRGPFSVAPLMLGEEPGYVYVFLRSRLQRTLGSFVLGSYIARSGMLALGASFLITLLLGLLSFFFLSKRLFAIARTVEQFEQGDYSTRVPGQSSDEIGYLGRAFNVMADTVVASIDALRRNDRLRRDFVANVSHDLRGPITSMRGSLEVLSLEEHELDEASSRKFLDIVLRNVNLLQQLVDDLFELSKLDAKVAAPVLVASDLESLAEAVMLKHLSLAAKAGVTLSLDGSGPFPKVSADPAMIERAISNLVENAVRYTLPGGRVSIELRSVAEGVELAVSDTGVGIPPESLPLVFERSYRVDSGRSKEVGGTGLGLAIVKGILEAHRTTIHVESMLEKGSRFWFILHTAPSDGFADRERSRIPLRPPPPISPTSG